MVATLGSAPSCCRTSCVMRLPCSLARWPRMLVWSRRGLGSPRLGCHALLSPAAGCACCWKEHMAWITEHGGNEDDECGLCGGWRGMRSPGRAKDFSADEWAEGIGLRLQDNDESHWRAELVEMVKAERKKGEIRGRKRAQE
ncbi:unnamed protein product [Urochloa humidicola]